MVIFDIIVTFYLLVLVWGATISWGEKAWWSFGYILVVLVVCAAGIGYFNVMYIQIHSQ